MAQRQNTQDNQPPAYRPIRQNAMGQDAEEILGSSIASGIKRAQSVVAQLVRDAPDDHLVSTRDLRFSPRHTGGNSAHTVLNMETDGQRWGFHRNGVAQLAQGLGLPVRFAHKMADAAPRTRKGEVTARDLADQQAKRALLSHALRELAQLNSAPGRLMVRSVHGDARAVLSPSYGRRAATEMAMAFIGALGEAGASAYSGAGGLGTWVTHSQRLRVRRGGNTVRMQSPPPQWECTRAA